MTDDLIATLGMFGGTFVVAVLSGLVPLINLEILLVGLVRLGVHDTAALPGIVIAAAVGQMIAKIGLYYAGQGLLALPRGRHRAQIEAARAKLERWQRKPYLIYALSSVFGLPPFYLTVLAAGAMKIRFGAFLGIGLAGRLARFAALVALAWAA